MVEIIDKNIKRQDAKDNRRKLAKIIEESIKDTDLKAYDTSSINWANFMLYKDRFKGFLSGFARKKVMSIEHFCMGVDISLNDNSYLEFAKHLGGRIEEDYRRIVRIEYKGTDTGNF